MSQQPPPYSPPYSGYSQYPGGFGYGYGDPVAQLLAPARRAGLLMIILGALVIAYGVCNGVQSVVIPADKFAAQLQVFQPPGKELPFSAQMLRRATQVISGIVGIFGLIMIVLGVFVRRGGSVAITISMILSGLLMLICGLGALGMVIAAVQAPIAIAGACVLAIPLVLLVLLFVWLVQAMRRGAQVDAARAQFQQQMWYQQQPQGYGYPQQPPPPPPPPQ